VTKFDFFCGGCGKGAIQKDDLCDPQTMTICA